MSSIPSPIVSQRVQLLPSTTGAAACVLAIAEQLKPTQPQDDSESATSR